MLGYALRFGILGAIGFVLSACASSSTTVDARSGLSFDRGDEWRGDGISYGPYREGQAPGGAQPSREELREDLLILEQHFSMIRMYGSRGVTAVTCELIREMDLDLKIMVGAWVETERVYDEAGNVISVNFAAVARNDSEVMGAIELANAYPDVVMAVNIGNESQVFWSGHRLRAERLLEFLERAQAATDVPVTTADDYNFWNKPESQAVAAACDFIVLHAYAMWNSQPYDNAIAWTNEQVDAIQALHPDHLIVLGETGWATQKHTEGEQATLIIAPANETLQAGFYADFTAWAAARRLPYFYFSAFDEPWKGGDHPNEVEKHWGLFRVDRTPKPAIQGR